MGEWPTISRNEEDTYAIQHLLNAQKPKIRCSCDGRFGSSTEKAVRKFQKAKGLTETGVVGPGTFGKLVMDVKPGGGNPGGAVKAVQYLLNKWGYRIRTDGDYGKRTQRQVGKFQEEHTAEKQATYIVKTETWKELFSVPKEKKGGTGK